VHVDGALEYAGAYVLPIFRHVHRTHTAFALFPWLQFGMSSIGMCISKNAIPGYSHHCGYVIDMDLNNACIHHRRVSLVHQRYPRAFLASGVPEERNMFDEIPCWNKLCFVNIFKQFFGDSLWMCLRFLDEPL
jgi:hypothetical protein